MVAEFMEGLAIGREAARVLVGILGPLLAPGEKPKPEKCMGAHLFKVRLRKAPVAPPSTNPDEFRKVALVTFWPAFRLEQYPNGLLLTARANEELHALGSQVTVTPKTTLWEVATLVQSARGDWLRRRLAALERTEEKTRMTLFPIVFGTAALALADFGLIAYWLLRQRPRVAA